MFTIRQHVAVGVVIVVTTVCTKKNKLGAKNEYNIAKKDEDMY